MGKTKIAWTNNTWNLTSGCNKVSDGCKNCYAEVMHNRLTAMKSPKYLKPFNEFQMHESEINKIPGGKKSKMVFIDSMSDFFHDDMDIEFIDKVLAKIETQPQHIFQILTKRSENIYKKLYGQKVTKDSQYVFRELGGNDFIENIWLGVTVENKATKYRIKDLVDPDIVASVKFLSIEPLLEDLELTSDDLEGIDWVIVGGESGGNSRYMEESWVLKIRDICLSLGIPFFFKQWSGKYKKNVKLGRELRGRTYDYMPIIHDNTRTKKRKEELIEFNLSKEGLELCEAVLDELKPYVGELGLIVNNEDKWVSFHYKNKFLEENYHRTHKVFVNLKALTISVNPYHSKMSTDDTIEVASCYLKEVYEELCLEPTVVIRTVRGGV